jgi:flavin reductase (DIM6/NTAB) family NADH-FMN oxidoreductase RutF
VDDDLLRSVMRSVATPVTVVTAHRSDDDPVGITVSAFCSVSAEPPIVLWCIHKGAESLAAFLDAEGFTVNFLPEGTADEAMLFATRGADKFGAASHRPSEQDAAGPVLESAFAVFECRTIDRVEMGDHWVLFGEVVAGGNLDPDAGPLVYRSRSFGRFVSD